MSPDWEKVKKEAVEILSGYIQVDTTNPPGNELAAARYLQRILEREGFSPTVLEFEPGRGNLVCRMNAADGLGPLVLLHHMDVVPAEPEKWRRSPFSGAVVDGEVWGRGAQDCKSLGVVELMALLLLNREGISLKRPIVYMATGDEETGGKWGVGWLFENHPELMAAEYVINEGGGLGMKMGGQSLYTCQTAEKGICWLKLTFRGKPGHGSIPHQDNCVVKMARAIEKISAYRSPLRLTKTTEDFILGVAEAQGIPRAMLEGKLKEPAFSDLVAKYVPDPGLQALAGAITRNTFVPTVVQAGQKTNVIPSECFCHIDCRILPGVLPGQVQQEIRSLLGDSKDYDVEILQTNPASESPVDNDLYRAIERTLVRLDPKARLVPAMQTGATDSKYFREKGVGAYGFQAMAPAEGLAAYLSRVHGHDERISGDDLLFGTRVLYNLLKDFCA
jgi:acetylornithine deacetylase/succinyl-diaminopimelate desuccinylase-like protein